MNDVPGSSVEPSPRIDPSVRKLLIGIWKKYPSVALRMKRRAREIGAVWYATTEMMEEFSKATTEAMERRDEATVRGHLNHVSAVLSDADPKTFEYIDVYYVEVLMYDLDIESKEWAWPLVPVNLQTLYLKFWGALK